MTVWPNGTTTRPDISAPFGYSADYDGFHGGVDVKNFNINCAVEDGVVEHAGWTDMGDGGAGIELRVRHDGFVTRELHNASVLVTPGQTVKAKQPLGVQGRSGYGSLTYYAKHCHLEVIVNGVKVDPVPFIQNRMTASAGGGSVTPFPDNQESDMKNIWHPDRGYAIVGESGAYGIPDETVDAIAARGLPGVIYDHSWEWDTDVREANLRGDALRALQTQHTIAALRAAGLQVDVDEAAIAAATAALIPTPPPFAFTDSDIEKLTAALGKGLTKQDVRDVLTSLTLTVQ